MIFRSDRPPLQQLRSRPEDHRQPRLAGFRARRARGRDIVMLSDGSPTRTFCYVADAIVGYFKVLVRGRDGESYNIGIDKPEISIAQLADMVVSEAADLFGYAGKVVRQESSDKDYLVDNPNRRCPRSTRRGVSSRTSPRSTSKRGCDAHSSGTRRTAKLRRHDEDFGSWDGVRGLGVRRLPG